MLKEPTRIKFILRTTLLLKVEWIGSWIATQCFVIELEVWKWLFKRLGHRVKGWEKSDVFFTCRNFIVQLITLYYCNHSQLIFFCTRMRKSITRFTVLSIKRIFLSVNFYFTNWSSLINYNINCTVRAKLREFVTNYLGTIN